MLTLREADSSARPYSCWLIVFLGLGLDSWQFHNWARLHRTNDDQTTRVEVAISGCGFRRRHIGYGSRLGSHHNVDRVCRCHRYLGPPERMEEARVAVGRVLPIPSWSGTNCSCADSEDAECPSPLDHRAVCGAWLYIHESGSTGLARSRGHSRLDHEWFENWHSRSVLRTVCDVIWSCRLQSPVPDQE